MTPLNYERIIERAVNRQQMAADLAGMLYQFFAAASAQATTVEYSLDQDGNVDASLVNPRFTVHITHYREPTAAGQRLIGDQLRVILQSTENENHAAHWFVTDYQPELSFHCNRSSDLIEPVLAIVRNTEPRRMPHLLEVILRQLK